MVSVITIDGPSGVGKSTVARSLARALGWRHLDTGAMYRAVALAAIQESIEPGDAGALADAASRLKIEFRELGDNTRLFCNGKDVTSLIRTPEVSRMTSHVADVMDVRKQMVAHQRQIGLERPSVAEGRDMGTVVFPDAAIKFYIDASLTERARRRHAELSDRGTPQPLPEVRADIERRDQRDRSRPYGALRIAQGAVVIDTTQLGVQDVVNLMLAVKRRLDNSATPIQEPQHT